MNRPRRIFRRLALALATAQLLAFAGAPVLDGITVGTQRSTVETIGPLGSAPTAPFHDVETCVACQVISTLACLPHAEAPPLPTSAAPAGDWLTLELRTDRFQRQGFHSRAPPALPS